MKESLRSQVGEAVRVVLATAALLLAPGIAEAQNARTTVPVSPITADKSSPGEESQHPSPMAEEMRIKQQIKYAEKEHRQKLDRAKEMSDLGQEVADSFKSRKSLDREALKKLEKLEKLAKRIRSEAGGSEDGVALDEKPADLAEAINRIAEASNSLNEKVQETPRQVISTRIIDKVNVLLELIRVAYSLSGKVSQN
ncbi:MAG: hypothetical protein ACREBC_04785 [Pyrinomonadaceae bacterium]